MNSNKTIALGLIFGSMALTQAEAAFINGEVLFAGTALLNDVPADATSIQFRTVTILNGFDDLGSMVGETSSFTSFTFGSVGTLGPNSVSPLVQVTPDWIFELLSINENAIPGAQRNIEGTGILSKPGSSFDPTPAFFSLSTSGDTTNVGFSASIITQSVPEPSSLLLLGLSGFGAAMRRRR